MGNHEKNNTMSIGKNDDEQSISVDIDGEIIASVPALKLLGVTIDNKLEFSSHISAICKKASRKVIALVHLRRLITIEAKLQISCSNRPYYLTSHIAILCGIFVKHRRKEN